MSRVAPVRYPLRGERSAACQRRPDEGFVRLVLGSVRTQQAGVEFEGLNGAVEVAVCGVDVRAAVGSGGGDLWVDIGRAEDVAVEVSLGGAIIGVAGLRSSGLVGVGGFEVGLVDAGGGGVTGIMRGEFVRVEKNAENSAAGMVDGAVEEELADGAASAHSVSPSSAATPSRGCVVGVQVCEGDVAVVEERGVVGVAGAFYGVCVVREEDLGAQRLRDVLAGLGESECAVVRAVRPSVEEMKAEADAKGWRGPSVGFVRPERSLLADAVLNAVLDAPVGAIGACTSDDPDICLLLRLNQSRIPVLLIAPAGRSADPRVASAPAAATFAAAAGLSGIIVPVQVLCADRAACAHLRAQGLRVFAQLKQCQDARDALDELGVDGVIGADGAVALREAGGARAPLRRTRSVAWSEPLVTVSVAAAGTLSE